MRQKTLFPLFAILISVCCILLVIAPVWAQEEQPAVTEPPLPEAPTVEPSPVPTEVPPPTLEPTPLPTEMLPPTLELTPLPTEVPPDQPTLIPTAESTPDVETTAEVTAPVEVTPEVTDVAEATLEVSPTVTETATEIPIPVAPLAAPNVVCDPTTSITRASINTDRAEFVEDSEFVAMSADGRYVVFRNFIENDIDQPRTFVYDRQTCQSNLLGDYPKDLPPVPFPGISTGRYVVYRKDTGRQANGRTMIFDIFLHDQMTGQDVLVSKGYDGSPSNETSLTPFLSATGRYISYVSFASNLVNGDSELCAGDAGDPSFNCPDLFLYDTQTGQNTRIALADGSAPFNEIGFIGDVVIAANDRFVVYEQQTTACFPYCSVIRLYEIAIGQTRTVPSPLLPLVGQFESMSDPSISPNGRYLVFVYNPGSEALDNMPPNISQIIWYDIDTNNVNFYTREPDGPLVFGNGNSYTPLIAGDGRFILYTSEASNLVSGDFNGSADVFLFDRFGAQTRRISVGSNGQSGIAASRAAFITPTGLHSITFTSLAGNLVADDTNNAQDVFVTTHTLSGFPDLPAVPILTSPANGGTIDDNTPLLTWNAAANAEIYDVEVDDDPGFTSPNVQVISLLASNTSYAVTTPLPEGLYYWWVESRNEVGTVRSSVQSFRINTALPDPPRLQYPANGGTVSTSRPAFSWFAVPNTRRYRIQVAEDANFTNLLVDTMEDSTVKAPITLLPGRYYWRMMTQNTRGVWGDFGLPWSFDYVIMQTPVHNGYSYGAFPIFTWNAYPRAHRYQLEIDNNADFSSPESVCIYTHRVLTSRPCGLANGLPFGDYYWRVNIDLGSGFIVSPIYYSMTVVIRNMPTPKPIFPINGNIIPSGINLFSWSAAAGAQEYEIQFSRDPSFRPFFLSMKSPASSTQRELTFPPGRYYWRIRAWFPGGKPGLWTTASFIVQ